MNDVEQVRLTVDADSNGQRLDVFLATQLPQFSRTQMRRSINGKQVLVDGQRVKASYSLSAGETVQVELPDQVAPGPLPECVPLKIIYEDQDIVAIDKPPGMVVHPARGHWTGTLASALAYHFESLSSVGGPARPGIVHRLDRDTSGVIIIAKNDAAHLNLCAQFESRTVDKCYHALVRGVPDRDADFIDAPIGAHPYQRERMAIRANHSTSREARTRYEVVERFVGFSYLHVQPETGRTHQIRVHMAHVGYPVVCDRLYAGHARISMQDLCRGTLDESVVLNRQALHAFSLSIDHPTTGQRIEFRAELPDDFQRLLAVLRQHRGKTN